MSNLSWKIKACFANFYFRNCSYEKLKKYHLKYHLYGVQEWGQRDFIFIHIPKTAGTSVNFSLGMPDIGHLTFLELNNIDPCSFNSEKKYFSILRDPVQRIISTFKYVHLQKFRNGGYTSLIRVADHKTLSSFVDNFLTKEVVGKHYFFRQTATFLKGAPVNNTYVINYNNIVEGIGNFSRIVGCEIDLPVKNSSSKYHGLDLDIEERHAEKIRHLYRCDYRMMKAFPGNDGVIRLKDLNAD